jgi:hypothetical protein
MEHDDKSITVWTENDHRRGWCRADQVGKPLEENPLPMPDAPGPDVPMSDDIFDIEYAAYLADPPRYRSSNASNLNKLLDVAARRQEKREEAPIIERGKLSAIDLQKMKLSDLMMLLTTVVLEHVPEDRQEAALRMLRR